MECPLSSGQPKKTKYLSCTIKNRMPVKETGILFFLQYIYLM